jgi:predicted RNase H-like HicB family nuclease
MTIRNIEADIMQKQLTAFIEREGNGYVSFCPELDIASQGDTIEEARNNLREALLLFFETASPEEVRTRLHDSRSCSMTR